MSDSVRSDELPVLPDEGGLAASRGNILGRTPRQWMIAFAVVWCCVYLPFAWLLTLDIRNDRYHRTWLMLSPILPGIYASVWTPPGDVYRFTASGLATLAIVSIGTFVGSRSRIWLFGIAIALLCSSIASSLGAYGVFRS